VRIAEIIGKLTLSKCHPLLTGATWLVAVPLTRAGCRGDTTGRSEPIVVYDELGANRGSLVGLSEGAEASAPFYPDQKPIDAYDAAILDSIDVE